MCVRVWACVILSVPLILYHKHISQFRHAYCYLPKLCYISDESDQTKKPKLEQVEEDSPIKSKAIRKKNHCVIESDSEDEMENRPPNEGKSQEDNDEQKPLQGEQMESSVDGQPETSMTPRKVKS